MLVAFNRFEHNPADPSSLVGGVATNGRKKSIYIKRQRAASWRVQFGESEATRTSVREPQLDPEMRRRLVA